MNLDWYRARLQSHAESVAALTISLDETTWRWRFASDTWSILEIVNHMADEETDDFRIRLRLTLEDPAQPWPGIDPVAWVTDRGYQERAPGQSLARFISARAESLAWLAGLDAPDWANTYAHPLLGDISAADLFTSWHAHDLLHLRQIGHRLYQYAAAETDGGVADYAGPW